MFLCGKFFSQQSQNGLRIRRHSVNQSARLETAAVTWFGTGRSIEHISGSTGRSSQAT
jgi:hypothetical protein